jgi:hypothetical protein
VILDLLLGQLLLHIHRWVAESRLLFSEMHPAPVTFPACFGPLSVEFLPPNSRGFDRWQSWRDLLSPAALRVGMISVSPGDTFTRTDLMSRIPPVSLLRETVSRAR